MSNQETKGLLMVENGTELYNNEGKLVAETHDTAHDYGHARRLAACWNFCQGVSTEQIEIFTEDDEKPLEALLAMADTELEKIQERIRAINALSAVGAIEPPADHPMRHQARQLRALAEEVLDNAFITAIGLAFAAKQAVEDYDKAITRNE